MKNDENEPVFIEFAGPSGVGKTTTVKKIVKNEDEPVITNTRGYSFLEKIISIPGLIIFSLIHFDLLKELYKQAPDTKSFIKNYRYVIRFLYKSKKYYKQAKKKEIKKIYLCENFTHILNGLTISEKIKNPEKTIKILNEKFYSKYNTILVYKELPTEEIVKQRKERKRKKTDDKKKEILEKQVEEYKERTNNISKKIETDIKLKTNSKNPKEIKEKINKLID